MGRTAVRVDPSKSFRRRTCLQQRPDGAPQSDLRVESEARWRYAHDLRNPRHPTKRAWDGCYPFASQFGDWAQVACCNKEVRWACLCSGNGRGNEWEYVAIYLRPGKTLLVEKQVSLGARGHRRTTATSCDCQSISWLHRTWWRSRRVEYSRV